MRSELEEAHYFYVIVVESDRIVGCGFLICLCLMSHLHDLSCSQRDIMRRSLDQLQKESRDSADGSPISQSRGRSLYETDTRK